MGDSFQHEIPRARVNISLDLETGGASVKKELPLKLLVTGDFSTGKANGELAERDRISVTGNNIEQVMADFNPEAKFSVPNKITNDDTEIAVSLSFKTFKDFHPEKVAGQIPQVRSLLAMRNLLKDLKSNLLDNSALRKEVERVLQNKSDLTTLKDELKALLEKAEPELATQAEGAE